VRSGAVHTVRSWHGWAAAFNCNDCFSETFEASTENNYAAPWGSIAFDLSCLQHFSRSRLRHWLCAESCSEKWSTVSIQASI
jgi:hypothetical protein